MTQHYLRQQVLTPEKTIKTTISPSTDKGKFKTTTKISLTKVASLTRINSTRTTPMTNNHNQTIISNGSSATVSR
jgi:hypothetical protein